MQKATGSKVNKDIEKLDQQENIKSSVTFRGRLFTILQIGSKEDVPSRVFDILIVTMIFLNISAMFLETFDELESFMTLFRQVEFVTLIFFCVEYVLRIWTADYLYPEKTPLKARLRFLVSFDGIVDLLTILPFFYLSGFIAFRMLRVVRIFHLFRLNARYDSFSVITNVLYEKRSQIVSSMVIIIILMLASSLGMYHVEHEAQPEIFRNAFSGIWWSVSTLLTVGYGDIYPVTYLGRILAIITAFLGVGVVAIPTGIISAGFVAQYTKKMNEDAKFVDIEEIGEIIIHEKHEFLGKSIYDIQNDYDTKILLILRDGMSILATNHMILQEHDVVILQSRQVVKNKKNAGKQISKRR